MDRKQPVFDFLDARGIRYEWYEHPEAPTIEIARQWWRDDGSKHCKNLFFRNHKGETEPGRSPSQRSMRSGEANVSLPWRRRASRSRMASDRSESKHTR